MKYEPQAIMGLSNFGGVSIMIDPEDEDYIYYKWYDEEPERTELYWNEKDEESDLLSICFDIGDTPYYLDEFMRVGI